LPPFGGSYSFGYCTSIAGFFASRMSPIVSTMIVPIEKFGGIERGG
jgi:hypothetical protein